MERIVLYDFLLCSQAGLFSSAFWGVARHFVYFMYGLVANKTVWYPFSRVETRNLISALSGLKKPLLTLIFK
jgi:hypothetical protein